MKRKFLLTFAAFAGVSHSPPAMAASPSLEQCVRMIERADSIVSSPRRGGLSSIVSKGREMLRLAECRKIVAHERTETPAAVPTTTSGAAPGSEIVEAPTAAVASEHGGVDPKWGYRGVIVGMTRAEAKGAMQALSRDGFDVHGTQVVATKAGRGTVAFNEHGTRRVVEIIYNQFSSAPGSFDAVAYIARLKSVYGRPYSERVLGSTTRLRFSASPDRIDPIAAGWPRQCPKAPQIAAAEWWRAHHESQISKACPALLAAFRKNHEAMLAPELDASVGADGRVRLRYIYLQPDADRNRAGQAAAATSVDAEKWKRDFASGELESDFPVE